MITLRRIEREKTMKQYNRYAKGIRKDNELKELYEKERLEHIDYEDDLSDLAEIRPRE